MANLSLVTDNYLPTASETFSDNLSGSIVAGAAIVPVNSAAEYADGETVVLTVEPGTSNEATFVGKKDTGVNQFIECIWTEGNTAVGHDAGATIIDYDSATHYNLLSKAMQLIMNQDGTLKDTPIRTALGLTAASANGWEVFPYTFSVASGYNQGDCLYDMTVANQDVRTILSEGQYIKVNRNTAPPTQCADLEASSSHYAQRASGSVTGTMSTITDDITIEANVCPESFASDTFFFAKNSVASNNGIRFGSDGAGRVYIDGFVSGGNYKQWRTRVGLQLGIWTHIAATMDLSGTASTIYFNGVSLTVDLTSGGTCTAFTNAGNIFIGCQVGPGNFYDGKISDVRVWNIVRTQLQIRDNMCQALVGSETNLIGYWKLDGNFNDSTSSANHLTGQNGAVATTTDHPFQTTQFLKIASVSYSAPNSTVRVLAAENHCLPNMTLTSAHYSSQANPYNYPVEQNRLRTKSAQNLSSWNPTNASVDLADKGLALMFTVPRACKIDVTFSIGVGATSDYEYRPQIRVNGTVVISHEPSAALTSAGGRAMNRVVRASVELAAGTNIVSGGLELASGAGYIVAVKGAIITASVPGSIAVR